MATILVRQTQTPYNSSNASEGLDFALGATNYGHDVIMLYIGEGVLQLVAAQTTPSGIKSHVKRTSLLPLYDIDRCYVCRSSLETYFPAALSDPSLLANVPELIETKAITALLTQVDHVVTF